MKKVFSFMLLGIIALIGVLSLSSCFEPAEDNVQHNLLQDTGNFKTYRKITVINTRRSEVLMEFEGYLTSKIDSEGDVNIIIKTGENTYQLHYVRLSQDISYLSEQLDYTYTDPYHWKISIYATLPQVDNA